jgi:hypothetical protein
MISADERGRRRARTSRPWLRAVSIAASMQRQTANRAFVNDALVAVLRPDRRSSWWARVGPRVRHASVVGCVPYGSPEPQDSSALTFTLANQVLEDVRRSGNLQVQESWTYGPSVPSSISS